VKRSDKVAAELEARMGVTATGVGGGTGGSSIGVGGGGKETEAENVEATGIATDKTEEEVALELAEKFAVTLKPDGVRSIVPALVAIGLDELLAISLSEEEEVSINKSSFKIAGSGVPSSVAL